MKKFDRLYKDIISIDNSKSSHLEILIENKNLFRFHSYPIFDGYCPENLKINERIISEAIDDMLNESEDPNYYVKLPSELVNFTKNKNNDIIDKYDILTLFPEFEKYKFPKIYIKFFDFSDIKKVKEVIHSFSNLKNEQIIKTLTFSFIGAKSNRGMHIHFDKFGIDVACLFFNKSIYNARTIYHEWTHIFQTYVGKDFEKIIQLSEKNAELKNLKLQKFGINIDAVRIGFFSEKEYVTHLDNLLYMIHQVQKKQKYKKINDTEFFEMFKDDLCKNELKSTVAQDILSIDENFRIDLIFFISAYICFEGEVFNKFCNDLKWRL